MTRLNSKWVALSLVMGLVVLSLTLVLIGKRRPQPKITWSEKRLEVILTPGESTSKDLTFTSTLDIENVAVEPVPEIAGFLNISPNSLANVSAGQAQSVQLSFAIPEGAELGTFDGTIHVRVGSQTLPQTLKVVVNVWQKLATQDLGIAFRYPPDWTTSELLGVVRLSNVLPETQPNPESMVGVCNIDFQLVQKPSGQPLREWLLEQHAGSGGPPPIELTSFDNGFLTGLGELAGEVTRVDTIYVALSDSSVLSAGLVCGQDMQANGNLVFEMVVSTIAPFP